MKIRTTVKIRAAAECPSHSLSNIAIRDLKIAIDEPVERDGTNLGPTPTESLIASLIGCTNVIGHKCADKLGLNIGHLEISAVCDFDRRGVTLAEEIEVPFERIVLTIEADGTATDAELQTLKDEVAKYCPLAKLISNAGTIIEDTWKNKAA